MHCVLAVLSHKGITGTINPIAPTFRKLTMQLLHIDSSILGDASITRQLTASAVEAWRAAHPNTQVQYLDLAAQAPAHFGADAMGFRLGLTDASLSDAQKRENAVTEAYLAQFLAADVVVIGAPLYNFTVPTQLKAWIDRLAQPGRTFRYTAAGPEGLAKGKTVIVVLGRGGVYSTSEQGRALEHQESYLQTVLGFFGVTDVRFVRAEGIAMGTEARAKALAQGEADIAAALLLPAPEAQPVAA
jgi:FMN-dependent NADH-azoreductase